MNLQDELLVGIPKALLERRIVGVETKEHHRGQQGDPHELWFRLVGRDDEDRRHERNAPGLARAAVGGHPLDEALHDVEMGLHGR